MKAFLCLLALFGSLSSSVAADSVLTSAQTLIPAENFPRFIVPGLEREMAALNAMHRLHYPPVWLDYPHRDPNAGLCTLWDEWLTGACLWADTSGVLVCDNKVTITQRLKNSFTHKIIDVEGYVATHQHEGIGHTLGWPFPYWIGSAGAVGVHFSNEGTASAVLSKGAPLTKTTEAWTLAGAQDRGINSKGWQFMLNAPHATATAALGVIDTRVSPFLQLRWAARNLGDAQPWLEWELEGGSGFSHERRMTIPLPSSNTDTITNEMIPLYRHPQWKGRISRVRLNFGNATTGAEVTVQALFSQYDTRHNINNFDFIRGAIDVFLWTGDVGFMRAQLPRLRQALRFAQTEFHTLENKCVLTTWVGHEGTSGLVRHPDGSKTILPGTGIGNNYWDLLPFGHKDSYATIRYYDTLVRMADLEREVEQHPEWNFPHDVSRFVPAELEQHAAAVKAEGNRIFWSDETGRFVAGPDRNGERHDYGFTFLNTDAIHYGFATPEHARMIMDWLEGKRTVQGDTSTGADIYHFRFGPRSTTRRNEDYYFWGWSKPESIPFGGQVQDGGAVLGWSYMDLSSRLKVDGPDNAWARLNEITTWFDEVQAGGGYREYYKKQGAALQGDGAAGGLGMDREFFESLLVPQIMLRGFLGFTPTATGCRIEPRLPTAFPSLTIDRIAVKGLILQVTASKDELLVRKVSGEYDGAFTITAPGYRSTAPVDWSETNEVRLAR
ncbi:MAG: hypothetical protein ABIZ04_14020 [Opitutus sp.]